MQQAIRWRRRRTAAWQVALARWLLAIAVVLTISPSYGRTVAADDTYPEHATADDGAPAALPQEPPASSRPLFAPSVGAAVDTPPADAATARADDDPQDEPFPSITSPAPVPGNRRVQYPTSSQAAAACPAELGAAKAASFGRDDRLVMTYYYYWYDEASLDDPALSQRPPADPPLDWRSVAWHERQLADMASAGVDVALAVYWGDTATWSLDGLAPMVEARERLLAAGFRPPAIGLFFDTNMYAMILPERPGLNDLTTDDGLDMPRRPDRRLLRSRPALPPCPRRRPPPHLLLARRHRRRRHVQVRRPHLRQPHRPHRRRATASASTSPSSTAGVEAAQAGQRRAWRHRRLPLGRRPQRPPLRGPHRRRRPRLRRHAASSGRPGYTRERTDGGTYSRDMRQAVMSGTTWLLLETWNELWEGTAIAETEETGRTYLGITARYTALFHQFGRERARDGWFDLGSGHNAYLRRLADAPIEQGMPAEGGGRWGARPLREEDDGTGYFHFALDRRLRLDEPRPLTVPSSTSTTARAASSSNTTASTPSPRPRPPPP